MSPPLRGCDEWAERAAGGLVEWELAEDETFYVGRFESEAIRILALGGFTPLSEAVVEGLSQEGDWRPLQDSQEPAKFPAKKFLFSAARYALIVRHDVGPPAKGEMFDVFLSYRSDEADLAAEVAVALRSEGIKVWYDRWDLPSPRGRPLEHYIRYALKRSSSVLRLWIEIPSPLLEPLWNEGRWVSYELGLASLFVPMMVFRLLPATLREGLEEQIPPLAEAIRASSSYETIANRVWHDEDPALYAWPPEASAGAG